VASTAASSRDCVRRIALLKKNQVVAAQAEIESKV